MYGNKFTCNFIIYKKSFFDNLLENVLNLCFFSIVFIVLMC